MKDTHMNFVHRLSGVALISSFVAVLVTFPIAVRADEQTTGFTYQGQLKDAGDPVNGSYSMQFRLYDTPLGGNQIGSTLTFDGQGGNPPQVQIADGLFSVSLDFGAAAFAGQQRWLQITINGKMLSPRQAVSAAPYAAYALSAANGHALDSVDGSRSNVIYVTEQGQVGVGTTTPENAEGWQGNVDLFGQFNAKLAVRAGAVDGRVMANLTGIYGSLPGWILGTKSDHPLSFVTNGIARMAMLTNGNVGIGTVSPSNKLSVAGVIETTSGGFRFPDGTTQSTAAGNYWIANGDYIYSNNTGNVGIGTSSPDNKMSVSGGITVDKGAANTGNLTDALRFGADTSGEGIGSKRNSGANQNGLDFFTAGLSRMSIANNGRVSVGGDPSPNHTFTVQGDMSVESPSGQPHLDLDTNATNGYDRMRMGWNGTWLYFENLDHGGSYPDGWKLRLTGDSDSPKETELDVLDRNGDWQVSLHTSNDLIGGQIGTVETDILEAPGKFFKIDHPLDPANKFLYHSCVESPDMKNIYDGVAVTDSSGYATVELPSYFEALNGDFRYQLTVVDESDSDTFVQAKVVRAIADHRFTIRTSAPGVTVSWQVTGIRHDAFAKALSITPEMEKQGEQRGRYMHPTLFGQPEDMGIGAIGKNQPTTPDVNH